MTLFSKTKKILLGVGAVSGVTAVYYTNHKMKVFASWTSNYEPSPCAKWNENWDHRAPQFMRAKRTSYSQKDENNNEVEKYKPTACRHLILVRHGQYNLQGETDKEQILTKLGREQAEYTGKRLAELGLPYSDMVKSTMSRAQETGNIISKFLPKVPVHHCSLLREGDPIPAEPPIENFIPDAQFFRNCYEEGARIEASFRKYFHRADPKQQEDSYTILVCHANVIRYLVCRALQFPAEGWLRISLNHASITWITITPSGRCILRALGDTGHMPPSVITFKS